jgi:lambda family phage portal protein
MPRKRGFFNKLFGRKPQRSCEAAKISRLLSDWGKSSTSIDEDIKGALTVLRSRSRDLCQNNDYGRRFMNLLGANVVGTDGIRLQSKVVNRGARGQETMDEPANQQIERAWQRWCRKENCTVNRKLSFVDVQRLIIQTVARDGEILIRNNVGFDNPFDFALQIIEPDYLDHDYSDDDKNIRMSVEVNRWGEPIAYHLLKNHPNNDLFSRIDQVRQRIPADDIIHLYLMDRADQSRGAPWTATALRRLHMLGHYEQSELVAARVGAAKMGFFTREDAGYPYDDKDSSGNLIDEVAPGQFKELPAGYQFQKFDIDHPNSSYDGFISAILKGAAAGLNVSYVTLANDLEGVNYSSIRQGALDERDYYRMLQGWMIEHFIQPVFDRWLPLAIAAGEIKLPLADIERWNRAVWQGRRWSWVDPLKDMAANEKAVAMAITSRTRIAAEQGADIDDVFTDLARENARAAALGLDINTVTNNEDKTDEQDDQDDEKAVSKLRLHAGRR